MKANIVDLRYKMKSILKALDRNETVTILYHGKEKGVIIPSRNSMDKKISEHPFFGMSSSKKSVEAEIDNLRNKRY